MNIFTGAQFTDTPANALTVDDQRYATQLGDRCDRFGYPPGGAWAGHAVEVAMPPGMGAALRASMR